MKAIVMAGGRGTRGRPYTDYFPKAMIPVGGVPIVERITRHLLSLRAVSEVAIVADYEGLGAQIRGHMEGIKKVRFVQDTQSGTGGDLVHAAGVLGRSGRFALWFADNLCAVDVGQMERQLARQKAEACIATRSRRREETGFAEVDGGMITRFVEKPVARLPMAECLGIYVLESSVLGRIRRLRKRSINLSYDVLQKMASGSRVCAYDIGDLEWIDAESPAVLERNAAMAGRITSQMGS